MEKTKRVFDAEFKREALALLESSGKPLAQIACDLGISDNTLQGWKQQQEKHGQDAFPGSGHQPPQDEEVRRLRRESEILRQERDILKNVGHLLTTPEMIYVFIDQLRHEYPIVRLCHILGVSKSGYYARRARPVSQHAREDGRLTEATLACYQQSRETHGSPWVQVCLQRQRHRCSRKRVARLMRQQGWYERKLRRRACTTRQHPDHQKAANGVGSGL